MVVNRLRCCAALPVRPDSFCCPRRKPCAPAISLPGVHSLLSAWLYLSWMHLISGGACGLLCLASCT